MKDKKIFIMPHVRVLSLLLGLFCVLSLFQVQGSELKPNPSHAKISQTVMGILGQYHYRKATLNPSLANIIFDRYVQSLDPQRIYFLQADIDQFAAYKSSFYKTLSQGDLSPAFAMYNQLQKRMVQQTQQIVEIINQDHDFKVEESLRLDRRKAAYAIDQAALSDIWRLRIKNELLNLILTDKPLDEAKKTLVKRYQTRLKRFEQTTEQDVFQIYMEAVSNSYDAHTSYFSPRASENFNIQMRLSLQGIGTVLRMDDEQVKVVEVVPGGPADLSHQINPKDEIIGVAQGDQGEMVDIVGWRLDDVVEKIRGERNTVVRLSVISAKNKGGPAREVRLVRDTIQLDKQAAQGKTQKIMQDGHEYTIGTITLPTFYSDFDGQRKGDRNYRSTTRDVRKILDEFKVAQVDGLVIDLRGNGGGSLQEAIELSGLFLNGQTVVQVKDSQGKIDAQKSSRRRALYSDPVVVLIDRLSASASEIFAAALQDHGRALIIGNTSFGKGTVQTLIPLDKMFSGQEAAGQLKLTVAKFYRANGASTQHKGVSADILLPNGYDEKQVGESAEEQVLPWDEIAPSADYKKTSGFATWLATLKQRHQQRMSDEPALHILAEQVEASLAQWHKKTLSLKEVTRRTEQDKLEKQSLDRENRLRTLYKLPLLTEDAVKVDEDDEESKPRKDDPDVALDETARILADLIALMKPITAMRATP